MHVTTRHIAVLVLIVGTLMLAACGGDEAVSPSGVDDADGSAEVEAVDDDNGDDAPDAVTVSPARAAAVGRRLDALVAAYTPVSARVNFLVSAEALRDDAVSGRAGDEIELERAGAVRVEVRRLRAVLVSSRRNVVDAHVASEVQQHVQQRMLAAIDARRQALAQLERALDAIASAGGARNEGAAVDHEAIAIARHEAWRAAWGRAARAAREATTIMQDERARVGIEPAPEESIR